MEENEYKDNEKVLYRTRCKLSLPRKKPEEVDCLVTEGHVVIEAEEPIKIPVSHIKDCSIAIASLPAPYSTLPQEPFPGTATLRYSDDLNKKHSLTLEMATGELSYFKQAIDKQKVEEISPKSRLAVTLFAYFLGSFGAHRFYLGKPGTAVLMLLTLGGVGIWALVDFIMAVTGSMRDKEGKLIKSWNPLGSGQRTALPTTAGIINIVGGTIALIWGMTFAALGTTIATDVLFGFGLFGVPSIVLGIIAIIGGIFALRRKIWGFALAGSICAFISAWGLGMLPIIFVALSKREFE